MKLVASLFTVLLTLATLAGAQEDTAPPPQPVVTDNYAYQILLGHYRENDLKGPWKQVGGIESGFKVIFGQDWSGSLSGWAFNAAVVQFFWGDDLSNWIYGQPMDPQIQMLSAAGFLGSSILLRTASSTKLWADFKGVAKTPMRVRFADVLDATDPTVQEDLARAGIRNYASEGRFTRIVGGLVNILAPVAASGLYAWYHSSQGKSFEKEIFTINSSMILSLLGGFSLLAQPSEGELLEARYLEAVSRGQR